ncbi:MAG: hypothetical protein IH586_22800 [Anaerolineaceae bacterium]|nr:hypothetical protein [Anaerolineaceae bacterium]
MQTAQEKPDAQSQAKGAGDRIDILKIFRSTKDYAAFWLYSIVSFITNF